MFLKKLVVPAICATLMSSSLFTTTVALAADENITDFATLSTVEVNVGLKPTPVFVEKKKTLKYVSADTLLNLRKEPKKDGKVVDHLDTGVVVLVKEEKGEWSKVKVGEETGYVATEYLKEVTNETLYVSSSGLNLRQKPTTKSESLTSLDESTEIKVLSEENGWAKVKVADKEGYVSAEYLTADKPSVVEQEQVSEEVETTTGSTTVHSSSNGSTTSTASTASTSAAKPAQSKPAQPKPSSSKPAQSNGSVVSIGMSLIGRPYVFGASGPSAFDCSGFISYVFRNAGQPVGRTSVSGYWSMASRVSNPVPGDLVFFQNTYKAGPSHMGIYIGGGQFVHAGDGGVQVSSTSNSYWSSKFLGYGRF
ncbi:MAG: NlpC/P60 family protein [Bacillaceae bacterium]